MACFSSSLTQGPNGGNPGGADDRPKRVIPYPHIREADVLWHKRVWRTIDLREKMNHPLYYLVEPVNDRKSLFEIIKGALLTEGSITAYNVGVLGQDDEFSKPLLPRELKDTFGRVDTTWTEDLLTGEMTAILHEVRLESQDIKQYRLKEDWIFDKQRGVVDIRIIGIAPMKEMLGEDGEVRGYAPLFWLFYPECRYVFAQFDAFNPQNDAQRMPFESLFMKRLFSSTITKVSNVHDRSTNATITGVEALLQGEEIKQELMEFEHDLWHW